jgi:hypothetical protein
MNSHIKYKAGYKYQLVESYYCRVGIFPVRSIRTEYIELTMDGRLTVRNGYAWDGPSGITIDTKTFMRGSLVHDALYGLMRLKHLPFQCRKKADLELYKICREDGMNWFRAKYVLWAMKTKWAKEAALPENEPKIRIAP